jgi:acyl-coenzyme A thioesterase PaaI-like protein
MVVRSLERQSLDNGRSRMADRNQHHRDLPTNLTRGSVLCSALAHMGGAATSSC